jgi:hypothetical protein
MCLGGLCAPPHRGDSTSRVKKSGIDFGGFAERSNARTVGSDLRWVDVERQSLHTGQTQKLSGVMGSIEYEGDFAECWSLLKLGEVIHVGKDAAFGNGRIRILPV